MKHEEDPAAEKGDSGSRHEPLVIGISEGVTAGYEALEYVLDGLRESLRTRRRSVTGEDHEAHEKERARRHRPRGGRPLDLEDLAELFAELLESAGEVVEEVAYFIRDRSPSARHPKTHGKVVVRGVPGKRAETRFHLHNSGSSVMRDVGLVATDLIGTKDRIEAHNVHFDPDHIEKIPIGATAEVTVAVAVPAETPPDNYSGLILAQPGGSKTILDLKVTARQAATEEAAAEAV
jgi:hypothetical protein